MENEKLKQVLELATSSSILFTIFFLFFVFGLKITNFDIALFTITSGPVLYSIKYYMKKGKDIFDEVVGIIFAYMFALIFYFVLTKRFDFIIVFYALMVYLFLKNLNKFILTLLSYHVDVSNPIWILVTSVISSFIVSVFLSLTICG